MLRTTLIHSEPLSRGRGDWLPFHLRLQWRGRNTQSPRFPPFCSINGRDQPADCTSCPCYQINGKELLCCDVVKREGGAQELYVFRSDAYHPPSEASSLRPDSEGSLLHFLPPSTLISIQNLTHGFAHIFPRTRMARMPL